MHEKVYTGFRLTKTALFILDKLGELEGFKRTQILEDLIRKAARERDINYDTKEVICWEEIRKVDCA